MYQSNEVPPGPGDQLSDRGDRASCAGSDRVHLPMAAAGGREAEAVRLDPRLREVVLHARECLEIRQVPGETYDLVTASVRAFVDVCSEMRVPPNHAAEIPALVVLGRSRGLRERSGPRSACSFSVRCGRRSDPCSAPVTCFHPRPREKAVIAARDQLRAVLEQRAIGGLADHPVVDHLGPHVSPVRAASHRPVDLIPRLQMTDLPGSARGQQHRACRPICSKRRHGSNPDTGSRSRRTERAISPAPC